MPKSSNRWNLKAWKEFKSHRNVETYMFHQQKNMASFMMSGGHLTLSIYTTYLPKSTSPSKHLIMLDMESKCDASAAIISASPTSSPPPPQLSPRLVLSPCAACKILRRRCGDKCVLAPYFPPTEPAKFTIAHRVFGASNIIKLLQVANYVLV